MQCDECSLLSRLPIYLSIYPEDLERKRCGKYYSSNVYSATCYHTLLFFSDSLLQIPYRFTNGAAWRVSLHRSILLKGTRSSRLTKIIRDHSPSIPNNPLKVYIYVENNFWSRRSFDWIVRSDGGEKNWQRVYYSAPIRLSRINFNTCDVHSVDIHYRYTYGNDTNDTRLIIGHAFFLLIVRSLTTNVVCPCVYL